MGRYQKLMAVMQREKEAKATWNLLRRRQSLEDTKRKLNVALAKTENDRYRMVRNNLWHGIVPRFGQFPQSRSIAALKKLQAAVRGAQYRAKNKAPMRKRLRDAKYPYGRVYNARRRAVRARSRTNFLYSKICHVAKVATLPGFYPS